MSVSIAGLFTFVIIACVVGLIAWVLTIVVGRAPFDPAIKQVVVWVIFAVAILIILYSLLGAVGIVAGGPIVIR